MLTGQSGILTQTSKAKDNTQIETEKEQIRLAMQESLISNNMQDNNKTDLENLEIALNDIVGKNKTEISTKSNEDRVS